MLILPIKRKWFDMILSGEKKEEYRDIKPYYDTRLLDAFGMIWVGDELIRAPMPELQKNRVQLVTFRNGYGKDVPTIWTECSLSAGYGREEWGAAWMFPEYVKIQDTRTMVLVVATLLIASIVLTVIMMGVLILAALPGNGVGIGIAMLITIIMALASGIIQLMAAVHFVPGFEIHGKLTYIILALLMAVFSIEEKKEA